ncbi:UDP-N-acetylmuramoyl-L-alanine--D-glutamate ligase [Sulfobacillus harzensis]|uniref:UDP-N-acetylmuramoylalanine--D-glutamate ligase n=1 Tax=Sulfobacillus harzensis TaxID=2729629 RepID=A0A7Y0Q127_9FIRM|nr:UDP-N-acetylmuramoyl-L-alanine--D-glutamate ligase [Sulfobacillus harzensis]NMP21663.1 UDP-N-acetylmuramoyl-L-alanine--D-glutamate ligase [Sulfobacillus harzensis]
MSSERIGIVGLGLNNRPLVPFLMAEGHTLEIFDRRSQAELEAELESLGVHGDVEIHGGPNYLSALAEAPIETLYLTPGMKKFGPELDALKARGVRFTCETDLFLTHCPAPVIGITGSAGKTTTTTLVGEALKRDGRRPVFVGGNIGEPLLPRLQEITPDSWVVMELSSFQLDLVQHSPHGAALLNLYPNHLDVHRDFEDYKQAKGHIFRFQNKEDWAVVPFDDAEIQELQEQGEGRPVYFSLHQEIRHGAFRKNGQLWWRGGNGARPVVAESALKLIGAHNVANALAAIAIVASAGGDLGAAQDVLSSFTGVPHRLEMVRETDGVTYINDSIATAPERTMAALKAIEKPIVLILGGYDKKLQYDTLAKALNESSVKAIVAIGEVKQQIAEAVGRYTHIPLVLEESFDQAVERASGLAQPGDVVLLSPAAASYDMFSNFEARGQRFREMVGIISQTRSGFRE